MINTVGTGDWSLKKRPEHQRRTVHKVCILVNPRNNGVVVDQTVNRVNLNSAGE